MTELEEKLIALKIEKVSIEIEKLKKPEEKAEVWNSLEWFKLLFSLLLPIIILIATCNLKKGEESRANDSRVASLRYEKFGQISEHINNIYCYFTYKGQWKELTPIDVIYEKRTADKIKHMYSFLFSKEFNDKYENFINECFLAGSGGWGKDALLCTEYTNRKFVKPTTRRRDSIYVSFKWEDNWDSLFITKYPGKFDKLYTNSTTGSSDSLNDFGKNIEKKYLELTNIIGNELKTNVSSE